MTRLRNACSSVDECATPVSLAWRRAWAALCLMAADRRASSLLEYALIASMVAVVAAIAASSVNVDTSALTNAFQHTVQHAVAKFTP